MWRREMQKTLLEKSLLLIVLITLLLIFAQMLPVNCCFRRDKKPPKIHWVLRYPEEPEYEDSVLIIAYVTDSNSGVANVSLCCRVNGQASTIIMEERDKVYFAEIQPLPYNSTVVYIVLAYDKAGNEACSDEYSYTVGDTKPPVIMYIQQSPAKPNYNDTVVIVANASEPQNASGVKELTISYNCGDEWKNASMELVDRLYKAVIPRQPFGTVVQYRVCAVDRAGNTAVFEVYSYTVEDQYLPVAFILSPKNGSFLSKDVNITLYAYDDNLDTARLKVDETLLALWNQAGTQTFTLSTLTVGDGVHKFTLEVLDKAGNRAESTISVIVDNTPPTAEIQQPGMEALSAD